MTNMPKFYYKISTGLFSNTNLTSNRNEDPTLDHSLNCKKIVTEVCEAKPIV